MGNLEVSGIRSEYTNNWQANKPLDEKERARRIANGIHVERKIADCEVDGSGTGIGIGTGGVGVGHGGFEGTVTRTAQIDFYEGMLFSEVKEKVFQDCFRDIDTDGDAELSKEEINDCKKYIKLREDNKKLHMDLKSCETHTSTVAPIIFGGIMGAGIGTLLGNLPFKKQYNALAKKGTPLQNGEYKFANFADEAMFEKVVTRSNTAIMIGLIAGGVGLAVAAYKSYTNSEIYREAKNRKIQLEEEIRVNEAAINSLKGQYSHIYR